MFIERIIIPAATLTLASIFSRVVCDGGGKFFSWIKEKDEDPEQLIAKASEQYVQNYAARHGILKVLGMREPVPLESVYTAVQFLDRTGISRFESIEDLEKGDDKLFVKLQQAMKEPYSKNFDQFFVKRPGWASQKAGCSMLSCSS